MEHFNEAKVVWSLAEWEPDEEKLRALVDEVIGLLDRALAGQLDSLAQAACYNIRGQCFAKLGRDEEAKQELKRGLKLRKIPHAQRQLVEVEARLAARERAESAALRKQRQHKYCCFCVPRCSRGPFKPAVDDFGGPAFAKLRQKTHILTSVAVGDKPPDSNVPPPKISWAWPETDGTVNYAKQHAVDRDILAVLESSKLAAIPSPSPAAAAD
jgi:hypothetical protein